MFSRDVWDPAEVFALLVPQVLELNARFVEASDRSPKVAKPVQLHVLEDRAATLATIYAPDQPGLFYRVAGAISLVGGNIIDARIHTTNDGMALDNLLVQDLSEAPFSDPHQLNRLEKAVIEAISGGEPDAAKAPPSG